VYTPTFFFTVALDLSHSAPGSRVIGEVQRVSGDLWFTLDPATTSWDLAPGSEESITVSASASVLSAPGSYSDTLLFSSVDHLGQQGMEMPDGTRGYQDLEFTFHLHVLTPILQITVPTGGANNELLHGSFGEAIAGAAAGGNPLALQSGLDYDLNDYYDTTGGDTLITLGIENLHQSVDLDGDGDPSNDVIDPELISLSFRDFFATGSAELISGATQTFAMNATGELVFRLNGQPATWSGTFGFFTDEWGDAGDAASAYLFTLSGTTMNLQINRLRVVPSMHAWSMVILLFAMTAIGASAISNPKRPLR